MCDMFMYNVQMSVVNLLTLAVSSKYLVIAFKLYTLLTDLKSHIPHHILIKSKECKYKKILFVNFLFQSRRKTN